MDESNQEITSERPHIFFNFVIILLLLVIGLGVWLIIHRTPSLNPTTTVLPTIGTRVKTRDCIVQGALPDTSCTPGAVIVGVTVEQVCTLGYSHTVRNVPESEKNQVYAEYGITSRTTGEYEVDHLISLELGGSNEIANLWPEVAEPRPGFHEKDKVENKLHQEVCKGALSLEEAQRRIATNWLLELAP